MNLKEQLIRDEGNVPHAYEDSLGYLTIGVGFLIDKRKGGRLPDEVCEYWLNYEIREKRKELIKRFPPFTTLSQARQDVLLNMAFNLGVAGLMTFKKTLALVESGDFDEASREMLSSKWADQVGARAARLSAQMRDNKHV